MTAALWILTALIALLTGALVIALAETRASRGERLLLLLWPVTIPTFWLARQVNRYRSTCRVCGCYFGSPKNLRRHQTKAAAVGTHDPMSMRPKL